MDSSKISALLIIYMLFISSATPIFGCGACGKPKHKPKQKHPKGPITLPPIVKPPVNLPPVTVPPIKPPVTLPPIVKPPVTLPPVTVPPIKPPFTLPPVTVPPIKPPVTLPPVTVPPIKPPINLPPVTLPPVTVPPIKPPVTLPPVTVPPIKPPVTLPPVTVPPINLPPVTLPPVTGLPTTKPPSGKTCPPSPGTKPATCPIDTLKLGACVDLLGGLVHVGLGDPVVNQCCPVLKGLVELEAAVCLCTTLKLKLLDLNIYVPLAIQLLVTCGKTPPSGYTCTL
ncbi:hypothetical protein Pint_13786 [Pistacia integerrima]|uniref:Uncharacterized protein n=1 Tax=Pistacia integerrima TaxID=434235 RepID=A0ACC0Y7A4_9ROSI|nr:hypothetical protein Pint_13786 [Pistacia integerrima]